MADQKQGGIAWTDATFNPVRGCRKLSAGCAHCYAAELSRVNPGVLGTWGANGQRVISPDGWEARFDAWEKKAAKAGKPMRVFVNSMWDPGEGPDVNGKEGRDGPRSDYLPVLLKLVQIARRCPHLRLQMLTKRPWNLVAWWRKREWYMTDDATGKTVEWPANLWVGASTENQEEADERIPWLLQLPAAVRFLSVEPMLGDLNIAPYVANLRFQRNQSTGETRWVGAAGGEPITENEPTINHGTCAPRLPKPTAWVIAGCESGRGARPMDLGWVRSLRDQCAAAGVPFFFKQAMEDGEVVSLPTLDGKVWDQFPAEVTP
jgi:protein gp37